MKIHVITGGAARRKPRVGDKKSIGGVLHERRLKIVNHPLYGYGHDYTGGRPHFEWVSVVSK